MAVLSSQWEKPIISKDSLGQDYCFIPRRPFLFGESKVPTQLLGPFYIGRYPVTNAQFKHFVDETGYDYTLFDIMEQLSPDYGCPAAPLSWDDARAYARWLRSITGDYYSLPTEAEWELSARGSDGRIYPWGNTPPTDKHGTFSLTVYRRQTNILGKFPMNISPYGCVDMVGNIWEWCQNHTESGETLCILRGGACTDDAVDCTCISNKHETEPYVRAMYAGLRVVYLPKELYEKYCTLSEANSAQNAETL